MYCMKGGFVHRTHSHIRDLFASLLMDECHDFEVDLHLQTLIGEVLTSSTISSDEACLDIVARGFWQRGQRAFFDVRVFNPFAKSHINQKLDTAFSNNENEKSDSTTSELLNSNMAPLASCVLTEWRKKLRSRTISHWTSPEAIQEEVDGL